MRHELRKRRRFRVLEQQRPEDDDQKERGGGEYLMGQNGHKGESGRLRAMLLAQQKEERTHGQREERKRQTNVSPHAVELKVVRARDGVVHQRGHQETGKQEAPYKYNKRGNKARRGGFE